MNFSLPKAMLLITIADDSFMSFKRIIVPQGLACILKCVPVGLAGFCHPIILQLTHVI